MGIGSLHAQWSGGAIEILTTGFAWVAVDGATPQLNATNLSSTEAWSGVQAGRNGGFGVLPGIVMQWNDVNQDGHISKVYKSATTANLFLGFDAATTRVGVGTSAPAAKLEVQVAGNDGIHIDGNSAGDARLSIENGGGTHYVFDDDSDANALEIEAAPTSAIHFNTNGANERMEISSTGNILFMDRDAPGTQGLAIYPSATLTELEGQANADFKIDVNIGDFLVEGAGNATNFIIENDGNVGIGTTAPARPLEVVGQIMSSNFNTYPQSKQSNFLMRHYDQTARHFAYFNAQSDAANNQVLFGGGAGSQYAATVVAFMTGANRTTLLGTEAMRVNNNQRVRISDTGGSITHDLTVYGTAAKTGGGSWSVASDKRIKKDVTPFEDGLEQILEMKPVNFKYIEEFDESGKSYVGVLAQDMQEVAPYTVEEVDLNYESDEEVKGKARNLKSMLYYNESAVTYMLVNAIKEQQEEIMDQEEELAEQALQMEELQKQMEELKALVGNVKSSSGGSIPISIVNETLVGANKEAYLKQNRPNPFTGETSIDYYVPSSASSAVMHITNTKGQMLKTIELDTTGQGVLNLEAIDLPSGSYQYTLEIDGRIIETKTMSLAR